MFRALNQLAITVALAVLASCSQRGSDDAGAPEARAEGLRGSAATSSSSPLPAKEDSTADTLPRRGLEVLAKALRSSGLELTEQGNRIVIANSQIEVKARINDSAEQDGRYILAAEFEILQDGQPINALQTGAIGIDTSAKAATETMIQEWASQYGAPIGFAIASSLGAARPPNPDDNMAALYARMQFKELTLFHGPVGIRGTVKDPAAASSDEFLRQVAGVAGRHLQVNTGSYRAATIQVVVGGTSVTGGECRIDGMVSSELLSELEKLTWPPGDPTYMFKLYLVTPKTSGPAPR